jgi:Flp pilus assembly protein TadD
LTAETLKTDDDNAMALARHAVFDAKLGNATEALAHIRRAVELTPEENTVLYKRAVVHALLNQRADAVEWLRRAVQKGYSRSRASTDPDLAAVRRLPQVEAMLRNQ